MHVTIIRRLPALLVAISSSLALAGMAGGPEGGLITPSVMAAEPRIAVPRSPFSTVAERRRLPSEYMASPDGGVEHPLMPALRWAREGLVDEEAVVAADEPQAPLRRSMERTRNATATMQT